MNLLASISGIAVATALIWSFSAATSQETQKALAATISTPVPTSNTTMSVNTINTTTLGKPFFEAKGKVIGTRILDVNSVSPKIEYSFLFNGMMNGVNVSATETSSVSFRPNGTGYGVGQGLIRASDGEVATYNGQGFGQTTNGGATIVHGLHIYSTTSTGKLAFLKNVVGIEEYDLDLMGNISVKEWAWK